MIFVNSVRAKCKFALYFIASSPSSELKTRFSSPRSRSSSRFLLDFVERSRKFIGEDGAGFGGETSGGGGDGSGEGGRVPCPDPGVPGFADDRIEEGPVSASGERWVEEPDRAGGLQRIWPA